MCRWSPTSTIKDIDRRCGRLRCAVARYVSVHVNVSGAYRHVPRNSATQTTASCYQKRASAYKSRLFRSPGFYTTNVNWSWMQTNLRLWQWAKLILAVHTFTNYQLQLAVKISTESLKRRILESWLTVISILKATFWVKSRHATGLQHLSEETLRIQISIFYPQI